MNGSFVEIDCPVCGSNSFKTVLEITPDKFLSGYRKKYYNLKVMGIDLHTKFYFKKCKQCLFVFVNPRFQDESYNVAYNEAKVGQYNDKDWMEGDGELARLYNTHSKYYAAINLLESLIYIKKRFEKVNNKGMKPIRLMDYGSGFGHILDLCKPFGIEAVGIEIDERRLEYCKGKGLDVRRPEELSEEDKFDVVISWSVLEHVNDLNAYFSYIAKRIHKGGIFIVNGLTDKMIYIERLKGTYKNVMPIEHINYFTPKSFNRLISNHGFETVPKMKMIQSIDNNYRLLFPLVKYFFKGFYPNGVFKMDLVKMND
jgi:2-polyprenyl-3-methyl-5-hydroxy-6-metoxy-1,4-benzoquinol methylase